jgi:hypothetical protein
VYSAYSLPSSVPSKNAYTFNTTAVKSTVPETAGGEKLHPAKIKITGEKNNNLTLLLILLFIPHYCTGMQDALIFKKKILELFSFFQAKEKHYVC